MASIKSKRFIEEYTIDFNATQAAIRAGYSAKTAYAIGHKLLKQAEIRDAIQKRINELTMTADEVLIRLGEMARGETHTRKVIDDEGNETLTFDEKGALEDIAKSHALFIDKQISQIEGLEIVDDDE